MIVWLASYPRSGNSLLRTVINQTLHLGSYNEYNFGQDADSVFGSRSKKAETFGLRHSDADWETFYRRASDAKDIFLVKTHELPRDDQPSIYVVRDGRKALLSYSRFHRNHTPAPYPTLLELILGMDHFGGWTQHFRAWQSRQSTIVRYEDLLEPSPELLSRLSATTGHQGPIAAWSNPFAELQRENPDLFISGSSSWSDDSEWTAGLDAIFFRLHGPLMRELGYVSEMAAADTDGAVQSETMQLVEIVQKLLAGNHRYRAICDERLDLIGTLQQACDQRSAVIENLQQECERRLAVIEELSGKSVISGS